MRLNDAKGSRNKCPNTPTIEKLIGVTNKDMVTVLGEEWRSFTFNSTNPDSELATRLKHNKKSRGWFVSVPSGVEKVDEKAHHSKTLW